MNTRERLRREIEATRLAYHCLLDSIPEESLSLPSDNPAWTVGQVFYHISFPPRYIILEVKMIKGQLWFIGLLAWLVPKRLFDWLNARLTRFGARRVSRRFLSEAYDRSHDAVLRALDTLSEADFARSMTYPDWDPLLSGNVTIEYLFGYIQRHFDSHATQIKKVIQGRER